MEVLLISLAVAAVVAFLATCADRLLKSGKENNRTSKMPAEVAEECCGAHEICEIDLQEKMSEEIIYYEDEELDAYKSFGENDYNDVHIDEFREVLYSLKENEITGWLKSLELRKIELPSVIKSELVFMMVKS